VLRAVRENARVRALSRHLALELPATLALLQRLDGPAITAVSRRWSRDPEKFIVSLCSTGAVLRHANANANAGAEIPRRYDDLV
jgi:hypothetical protein